MQQPTISPGGLYGIWHLEPGDTIEIYWHEGKKDYSTFQKIFPINGSTSSGEKTPAISDARV